MSAEKFDNVWIGINGRMGTLQTAALLTKMEIFPEEVKLRQAAAGDTPRPRRAPFGIGPVFGAR